MADDAERLNAADRRNRQVRGVANALTGHSS
jgi:hypothetical protein